MKRQADRQVVCVPGSNRVVRYKTDQTGNDLTTVLRWCSTHDEPVWEYSDGSSECPHELIVGCSSGPHVLVDPPWES